MGEHPIRFGILGCAEIAKKVSRAIRSAPNTQLYAIGSRSIEKARKFALDNGFPADSKIYGSYDEVLDDPCVDAVYVPLPTSLHRHWAVEAAKKKKHLLLEKPTALDVGELDLILEACDSNGVQFMDGTMWMHHPRTAKMKELIADSGQFGQLKSVMAEVEGSNSQPQSSAPQPPIGGKKVVTFDIFGSPVGEQSDKFTSFVGRCVRTHISVAYETWKSVPQGLKDQLWEAIMDEYEVPSRWRKKIEAHAGCYWRNQRGKLRASKIFKHTRNLDEIKKDVPPHIRDEDWAKFVDQTFTLKALKKRTQAQAARSKNIALHRTGRTGAARTRYKMEKQNPGKKIERTEVFIGIHTSRKGIGRNEELDRKLGRVREIVENNPSSVSLDVDNDPVAEIFGKDSRGRVRGYGSAISRTALKSMQPIIDQLGQQNESHPIEKQALRDMVRDIIREDFAHHPDLRSPTSAYSQTRSVNEQNHTFGNVTDVVNLLDMMGSVVAIGRATLPEGEVGPMRCDVVLDMILEPNAPIALDPAKRIMALLDVGDIIKWPTILVAKRSI